MHKVIHHPEKLPDVFCDYFEFSNTFHCCQTRPTNNIHIFRADSSFGNWALRYK